MIYKLFERSPNIGKPIESAWIYDIFLGTIFNGEIKKKEKKNSNIAELVNYVLRFASRVNFEMQLRQESHV